MDLKKKSSTKKGSAKGRLAGRLKKAVKNSQNEVQQMESTASKWMQIKEEEEPKPAKVEDFRRFSIDVNLLKDLKYKGASSVYIQHLMKTKQRTVTYYVKKPIPKEKRQILRSVLVLKPADPDSTVKPLENVTNYAGPQFTREGRVIDHSILGSYDDFRTEAQRRGEFMHLYRRTDVKEVVPNLRKGDKSPTVIQSLALRRWYERLREWRRQQEKLSIKVQRPIGDMLMRTQSYFPSWLDLRKEIGIAAESTMSGYGRYRVIKQFWKEPLQMGLDDESPLFPTYGQSVQEGREVLEFRGIPSNIQTELAFSPSDMGTDIPGRSYKPYHTDNMEERKGHVKDMIHILNPHHPDLSDLMVKGEGHFKVTSKECTHPKPFQGHIVIHSPFKKEEETESFYSYGFQGPALLVGNQLLTWEAKRESPVSQAFITEPVYSPVRESGEDSPVQPLSLFFTTKPKERKVEKILLRNCGSTLIHYDLVKVPIRSPFGLFKLRRQQFYFLSENGTLPPGGTLQLPVLYKSECCGMFKETWKLKTQPVLCGGVDILIHFRAMTVGPPFMEDKIYEIQRRLNDKSSDVTVRDIINDLVFCVEEKSKTLILPLYISPEEEFNRSHPGMFYKRSHLQEMEKLYLEICGSKLISPSPEEKFSVQNLLQLMCRLDYLEPPSLDDPNYDVIMMEREDEKDLYIEQYLSLTRELSFKPVSPCDCCTLKRRNISSQILQRMVEEYADSVYKMAYRMGIPVKSLEPEDAQDEKTDKKKKKPQKGRKGADGRINASPNGPGRLLAAVASRSRKKGTQSPLKETPGSVPSIVPPRIIETFSPVLRDTATTTQQEVYKEKLYLQEFLSKKTPGRFTKKENYSTRLIPFSREPLTPWILCSTVMVTHSSKDEMFKSLILNQNTIIIISWKFLI